LARSILGSWLNPDDEDCSLKRARKLTLSAAIAILATALASGAGDAQQAGGFSSYFQSTHGGPVDITGRTFFYDYKTDSFVVNGDAVITQYKTVLTADQAEFNRRDRIAHATGKVHIVDPLGDIRADEGTLNLNDESGVLTNATITNHDKSYLLKGDQVEKLPGQRYKVMHGFFTTCGCDPEDPDWSVTGQQMDVHMGATGTAREGYFDVLNHPIAYFPYFVFPADTDRSSGLLGPRLGESGFRGFQLLQPFYWDINKNSDATVALDLETSLRVGALAEYRLITGEGDYFIIDGGFYNEVLRSEHSRTSPVDSQLADPDIPINRYNLLGMMREHLTPNLVVYGDGATVSDSLTLRELNVWTLSRTVQPGIAYPSGLKDLRDALSDVGILDSYDNGFARVQGTWNEDLIQPQRFALQTLPDLLLSGREQLPGGLAYIDYDVQGDNFWRVHGQEGVRLDLSPRVTVPFRLGDYLYGWGTLGLRETLYSVSGDLINVIPVGTGGREFNNGLILGALGDGGFHSREMITGSAGLGTEIEKVYDVGWLGIDKIKHTIEPFATYAYVPSINQSQLPLFDEIDRVEPRSLFTYGMVWHFYAKLARTAAAGVADEDAEPDDQESGSFLPFRARSSTDGSAVVELLRLSLLHAYDASHAIAKGATRFADLDLRATAFPTNVWSLGGLLGYSPVTGGIRNASVGLTFQPWWTINQPKLYLGKAEAGSFLEISYDYIAPGPSTNKPGQSANLSQFISGRLYYDLSDRFLGDLAHRVGVYVAPSYDFVKHKVISAEYGLRLKSPCDCWAFDMGVTKTINPSDTSYQFQVTLGGLGSVGQSPFGRNPFQTRMSVLPNYR
jgi:LPS-assembly protein